MRFSIITPTHNTKYLKELEQSILAQVFTDWEWIIVLNNGAEYSSNDARIKVIQMPFKSNIIGQIKKYAFSQGIGDILVEVDHDDILTPDCLKELDKAFTENIGFVYSDNAKLSKDFIPYNPENGWTYEMFTYKDNQYYKMNSLPQTPKNLSFIWFLPDHVRAWKREVYHKIGGHNDTLVICDDQELLIRTYLETNFKHIPLCLYLYRIHGENEWLKHNKEIQQVTTNLADKYIERLAIKWSKLNNLDCIDLCGGFNKPSGYISIDLDYGDIKADLNKGIPLPDSSCGVIRAYDALEHLQDKTFIMQEIHRVLAPNGLFIGMTPSTDGRGAFQDPTHVTFWNEHSFWYYTRPELAKFIYGKVLFKEIFLNTISRGKFEEEHNIKHVYCVLECKK